MKVFVTGATGFVGSAVVQELLRAGHQVLGLARSESSAQTLRAAGADVQQGSLDDFDSLRSGAAASDGVIHTAFNHDFSNFVENCDLDRRAVEALGMGLEGSDRPLLVTSGLALLTPGRPATEDDAPPPVSETYPRASEAASEALAARGMRSSVVRLAPSVHGEGDHGFVPALIGIAREKAFPAYIGEGKNRWAGVHRLDAARLYRLALEKSLAGARFHGVADEGVPTRDIAETIGRRLNVPVVSLSSEKAAEHFGWIGFFFGLDCAASSAKTQELLGWCPAQPGLLADLDQPYYFK